MICLSAAAERCGKMPVTWTASFGDLDSRPMDSEVYRLFEWACPLILGWILAFVVVTMVTLMVRAWRGQVDRHRDTLIGGEMPGILLVLMHSVCFVSSLLRQDWVSALVFGWWGPGFLIVAIMVLTKRRVDWRRIARATSISCKINYLILIALFIYHDAWAPVFAYSLWIMHDQVRLLWLQHNADRTRRLCEDWWLPRICYPGFLFVPFFIADFPLRWPCVTAAGVLLMCWIWGLNRLFHTGGFFVRPASFTDNLRDIVYLQQRP